MNIVKYSILLVICFFANNVRADDGDALDRYNRAMYGFNTHVDDYVLKPVAKGYRAVTNDFMRERVKNFFSNLKQPASAINHTLQGNFGESGKSVIQFVVNSTLGLLGTFDVASGWGLEQNQTDLDQTLANWCVPDGPFIMLPLLGPSTPRATTSFVATIYTSPTYWANSYINFGTDAEKYSFYYGIAALGFVSVRENNLELLDSLTAGSVDAYTMIKSAYIQSRLKINVCKSKEDAQASYDFDFDEDFDE